LLCDKNGKTLLMRKVRKPDGVIGVYAGSFDPLTVGHVWMIAEGAKLFPSFIVAIDEIRTSATRSLTPSG
jgi:cytidyltransferase-like protein